MKLSQFIHTLQHILDEQGDMGVVQIYEMDEFFAIEECNRVEVVSVPKDPDQDPDTVTDEHLEDVVAVGWDPGLDEGPILRAVK